MIMGWMARVAVMVFGVGGADTGNEVLEVLGAFLCSINEVYMNKRMIDWE